MCWTISLSLCSAYLCYWFIKNIHECSLKSNLKQFTVNSKLKKIHRTAGKFRCQAFEWKRKTRAAFSFRQNPLRNDFLRRGIFFEFNFVRPSHLAMIKWWRSMVSGGCGLHVVEELGGKLTPKSPTNALFSNSAQITEPLGGHKRTSITETPHFFVNVLSLAIQEPCSVISWGGGGFAAQLSTHCVVGLRPQPSEHACIQN